MRIELTLSAWKAEVLPLNYIRAFYLIGAEDEIRTRDPRLGKAMYYPCTTSAKMVEEDGFEPSKAQLTDLQSAPFGHSGIPPEKNGASEGNRTPNLLITNQLLYR